MKNYMTEVAKLLDVEFGEEFEIRFFHPYGNPSFYIKAVIDDKGLIITETTLRYDYKIGDEVDASCLLACLLRGECKIIKPWKPKNGECYYYVNPQAGVFGAHWNNCTCDVYNYKLGNCYRTPEEANANSEKWIKFYASEERIEI